MYGMICIMYCNRCWKFAKTQIIKIDYENILGLRKISNQTIRTKKINSNEK